MDAAGWIQLALIVAGFVLITKPLGVYLVKILDPDVGGEPWLARALGPVERLSYRVLGVDAKKMRRRSRPGRATPSRWCSSRQ